MSRFKGTLAPWRCHDKRPSCSGCSIVGNDGQYIGFVGDSDELSPIDTNANIIAAAPELLEALIEISEMQKLHYGDGMTTHIKLIEMVRKADLAIAKALGETK